MKEVHGGRDELVCHFAALEAPQWEVNQGVQERRVIPPQFDIFQIRPIAQGVQSDVHDMIRLMLFKRPIRHSSAILSRVEWSHRTG